MGVGVFCQIYFCYIIVCCFLDQLLSIIVFVKLFFVFDIVIYLIYYVDLLKKINFDVLLSDLWDLLLGLNYLVLFVK